MKEVARSESSHRVPLGVARVAVGIAVVAAQLMLATVAARAASTPKPDEAPAGWSHVSCHTGEAVCSHHSQAGRCGPRFLRTDHDRGGQG